MAKFLLAPWLRLRNTLDYPMRQFFHWRRTGLRLPARSLKGLFDALPREQRGRAILLAARLLEDYHLQPLAASSTPGMYRENLFYLDMLATALERSSASLPDSLTVADIGPSHWFYVQALFALLRWWRCPKGRDLSLTGYEVDAYRIYSDLHSRYDYAQAHIRNLSGVTYLPQAFTRQPALLDLVLMLFPFVFEPDHLRWGLPAALFEPERLLADAWSSIKPGGVLIIVNQGFQEHQAQQARLAACGILPRAAYRQDPLLYTYDLDRYVLVCVHE
jgi:hypothetical protein